MITTPIPPAQRPYSLVVLSCATLNSLTLKFSLDSWRSAKKKRWVCYYPTFPYYPSLFPHSFSWQLRCYQQIMSWLQVPRCDEGLEAIIFTAQGDMRHALNNLQSTYAGFGFVSAENVFKVRLKLSRYCTDLTHPLHRCVMSHTHFWLRRCWRTVWTHVLMMAIRYSRHSGTRGIPLMTSSLTRSEWPRHTPWYQST